MGCCPGIRGPRTGSAEPGTEMGRTTPGASALSPGWARPAADGQRYPLSQVTLVLEWEWV